MELTIKNLSKTYGNGVKALNNVNLTIQQGMYGLLGPNGAGKSTLMRTIATLQEADSGSIQLNGLDVLHDKEKVRKLLGYLPQEFGVYPKVSAQEMLNHVALLKGLNNKKERSETVNALLEKVNLHHVRKKKLGTFSGGMKQRFGIAQALIGSPQVIIVDEPTAGLDPTERNRFHNLLSELGENTIVILSTHIVDDVTNLCQDMAIICLGEVIERGNPSELVKGIKGKIWHKTISKEEVDQYRSKFKVINTQLVAGKTDIHVHSETKPDDSFRPADAELEDVYFTRISEKMDVITI